MNKQYIEKLTNNNENIIVTTEIGSLIGFLVNLEEDYIELKVAQSSFIKTDNMTHLENAIVPINKIISICTFTIDTSNLKED